ncbi:hypothetical protein M218_31950 [Burkholderia pseudomallei MSHR338]|nr:hypothetical protein M218_31950 [Burkholderia pseudomallei MSHR338]
MGGYLAVRACSDADCTASKVGCFVAA